MSSEPVGTRQELDRYHEIEIEKLFDAAISFHQIRIQIGTFFGTVNLATASIAISTQKARLLLIAGIMLWPFIYLDHYGRLALVSLYARSHRLHTRFSGPASYSPIAPILNPRWVSELDRIIESSDDDNTLQHRIAALHIVRWSRSGFWMPLIASCIEVISGIVLWKVSNWTLF